MPGRDIIVGGCLRRAWALRTLAGGLRPGLPAAPAGYTPVADTLEKQER